MESDKNTKDIILKYDGDNDADLPIVKDVGYSTLEVDLENKNVNTSTLSLDILSDLKPSGDTLVSDPISMDDDTDVEKKFFDTQSSFTKEDFLDDGDDVFYEEKNNSFGKIVLLIIGLASIFTALYFVIKEYTNIF